MYVVVEVFLAMWFRHSLLDWSGNEGLYTLAAVFGASAGTALTAALVTEAIGYVMLLIPNRIREIKEEGRAEGRAEGHEEGREEGLRVGRVAERERMNRLFELYDKGEITRAEFLLIMYGRDDDRTDLG